ncbi:LuxR family transcriptional regulator [Xanthomonas oryzae]|uniref:LuxR family transcriptional regulator n=1 Tax=Xanthomonas oryzae pv. oryzae TaxID=64187 RepID=A0AAJ5SQ74_XANOO|nr:LuxR family transcriptional regulator [Xanthomonas oryzae]OLI96156.1 LuxR family transcriptional regulator [Xanthomonas oryzae pv. oryzae]QIE20143.1 LuxR family transcriptional regulator [Xanthomonas oryzae pv. oryzae]UXV79232.1 LuxR family transcriptional regulator [Xanthomonas oryzae pv. oryzae]UXW03505.1 LuxR family transcriptional regulator [Xanthomonas oryzae pv. oryzae]UXW18073.1 LuxR family transcriptional regulator [Xanthomonas oryzae pv. oryzae]
MVDMKNDPTIVIWEGCDPTVSEAIEQFEDRWRPYSASSRRYPIVGLLQELIDPAVAAYTATLPQRYLGHIPGAGTGVGLSGIIRLVGLDAMVRMQRQLLRQFIKTEDRQTPRDRRFVATLESLIGLVWDCACKRPVKSKVRDTRLNGERLQGFCRFCGSLAELTSFAGGSDDPKADDPEEKLRLSSLYCLDHRPKLPSGAWNPVYRQARRSLAQFDLELARLNQQCAKPATAQVKSGDQLVDSYFFHYVAGQTLQPADKAELRNQARLMVDSKLSDRKKQMLMLQWSGLNQSEIARKLGIERQAVSKALTAIPAMFRLSTKPRSRRQSN